MRVCFRQCNADDCYRDDAENDIYDVSPEAAKKMMELIKTWKEYDENDFHLCEDCFEEINSEYPDLFEIEDDVIILKGENERD